MEQVSILESAQKLGVGVFTSVPLMQGKLLEWVKNSDTFTSFAPSVAALQFIRSTPGVLSPLIGQKSDVHVSENMQVMKILPFSENEFQDIIKKLMS
jgi:aryl-alcohol dehydrogenase-like predicted oxidoreductase